MRRLFILRPQPGADRSAARAKAMGLEPVLAPLFVVRPVEWRAPEPSRFDALLLTSANAVRCAGEQLSSLHDLQVHAIGEATAAAAREAGFDVATIGRTDIDALLRPLPANLKLLHLCGTERRIPADPAQEITDLPVYRADPLPAPPELAHLGGQVAAAHSPRAAARLAELIEPELRATIRVAAISDAAAAAAREGWERVEAAASPSDEALLALAARLCDKGAG